MSILAAFRVSASCAVLALAACSPVGEEADDAAEADMTPPPGAVAVAPPVPVDIAGAPGGDLADDIAAGLPSIELAALEPQDLSGKLEGELRCAFQDADGALLLIASANVGQSQPIAALVKVESVVETLTVGSGGYDRMVDGAAYSGNGLIATITPKGEDMTPGEGLTWRADLHLENARGDMLDLDGVWSCGP